MFESIIKSEYFKVDENKKIQPLKIKLIDVMYINAQWRTSLPNRNFIDEIIIKAKGLYTTIIDKQEIYEIEPFMWYGDMDGKSVYPFFLESVVPYLIGEATVCFTTVIGGRLYFEIKKGKYTRKYAQVKLVDNLPET